MKTRTRRVVCWVERDFDAWGVAGACQILSEAGRNWNWRGYRITLASSKGGLVPSNAQLAVDTVPLSAVEQPDVLIVGKGEPSHPASPGPDNPLEKWSLADMEWLCLRGGLLTVLRLERFAEATVAAPPQLRPRLSDLSPSLRFTDQPWHRDGQLRTTATPDASDVTLDLVQAQIGKTARRAVEATLGLNVSLPGLQLRWPEAEAEES